VVGVESAITSSCLFERAVLWPSEEDEEGAFVGEVAPGVLINGF
jgi:hypothetical protein